MSRNSRESYIQSCKATIQNLLQQRKLYIYYLRYKDKTPYGVVVGIVNNNDIFVGYSKCNLKDDRWNRYIGIMQAINKSRTLEEWMEAPLNEPDRNTFKNLAIMNAKLGRRLDNQKTAAAV